MRLMVVEAESRMASLPAKGLAGKGEAVSVAEDGRVGLAMAHSNEVDLFLVDATPQDLPHIFERFYRSDKSRNRDSGGAGLGLSLAKWIVDAHGGFIEVESAVDRGSTFRVSTPKVPA